MYLIVSMNSICVDSSELFFNTPQLLYHLLFFRPFIFIVFIQIVASSSALANIKTKGPSSMPAIDKAKWFTWKANELIFLYLHVLSVILMCNNMFSCNFTICAFSPITETYSHINTFIHFLEPIRIEHCNRRICAIRN